MKISRWFRNESPDSIMEAYIRKQPPSYWQQLHLSYSVIKELITVSQSKEHQTMYFLLDDILAKSTREKYMIGVVLNRFVEIVTEVGTKQQKQAVEKLGLNSAYLRLLKDLEDLKTQYDSFQSATVRSNSAV